MTSPTIDIPPSKPTETLPKNDPAISNVSPTSQRKVLAQASRTDSSFATEEARINNLTTRINELPIQDKWVLSYLQSIILTNQRELKSGFIEQGKATIDLNMIPPQELAKKIGEYLQKQNLPSGDPSQRISNINKVKSLLAEMTMFVEAKDGNIIRTHPTVGRNGQGWTPTYQDQVLNELEKLTWPTNPKIQDIINVYNINNAKTLSAGDPNAGQMLYGTYLYDMARSNENGLTPEIVQYMSNLVSAGKGEIQTTSGKKVLPLTQMSAEQLAVIETIISRHTGTATKEQRDALIALIKEKNQGFPLYSTLKVEDPQAVADLDRYNKEMNEYRLAKQLNELNRRGTTVQGRINTDGSMDLTASTMIGDSAAVGVNYNTAVGPQVVAQIKLLESSGKNTAVLLSALGAFGAIGQTRAEVNDEIGDASTILGGKAALQAEIRQRISEKFAVFARLQGGAYIGTTKVQLPDGKEEEETRFGSILAAEAGGRWEPITSGNFKLFLESAVNVNGSSVVDKNGDKGTIGGSFGVGGTFRLFGKPLNKD
jgi:hypothetical protein